jgi:hypothetical protein
LWLHPDEHSFIIVMLASLQAVAELESALRMYDGKNVENGKLTSFKHSGHCFPFCSSYM